MKLFGKEYNEKNKHITYHIFGFKISKKDKLAIAQEENNYLRSVINYIGTDKIPPASGELRQWQLELLDLMKEFDKVCRDNNVQYWLEFGTLLGAIRHKGFIPWDDDIDTSMMKSDSEKILPILKEHFKNSDFIVRERAVTMNNFQIRIRHKDYNMGLDIFQVYNYPHNEFTPEFKNNLTNKIINARKVFDDNHKTKFMTEEEIKQAQKDIYRLHNELIAPVDCESSNILIHGIDYPYLKSEYVINSDLIFPLKEAEFEGCNFLIPNKPEEYAATLWKNWKDMPATTMNCEHYFENYKSTVSEEK